MAMTANSILFFQKILRCLGRGMRSVKRRDSQFPALKPAAVPQGMIDFIIGKNKRGGLFTLRACCDHVFNQGLLFNFRWEQRGLFHRFGYA